MLKGILPDKSLSTAASFSWHQLMEKINRDDESCRKSSGFMAFLITFSLRHPAGAIRSPADHLTFSVMLVSL